MDAFDTDDTFESQEYHGLNFDRPLLQKEFGACAFVKCTFRETSFHDSKFKNCTFKKCTLSLVDIKGCTFIDTRFEDSQLIGFNWTEAVRSRSKLSRFASFNGCVINHSSFFGMDLKKIGITRCVARDVDFAEANLSGANLTFTDFSQSRFLHTDLTEADFTGASGYAISPNLNTLKQTKFSLPEAMTLLYGLDIVLTDYPIDEEQENRRKK